MRGANYVPSFSRNPVQTWIMISSNGGAGWAQGLNFNSLRVFMHLFAWAADRDAFLSNYDHFLTTCAQRGVKPLIVLFDDDFFDVNNVSTAAAVGVVSG